MRQRNLHILYIVIYKRKVVSAFFKSIFFFYLTLYSKKKHFSNVSKKKKETFFPICFTLNSIKKNKVFLSIYNRHKNCVWPFPSLRAKKFPLTPKQLFHFSTGTLNFCLSFCIFNFFDVKMVIGFYRDFPVASLQKNLGSQKSLPSSVIEGRTINELFLFCIGGGRGRPKERFCGMVRRI